MLRGLVGESIRESSDFHVTVEEFQFTLASNSELALSLFLALRDHHLELPALPTLADELLNVRLKEIQPNVWRIDHTHGRHDDQAITVAMACWWHTQHNAKKPVNYACAPVGTRNDPSEIMNFDNPAAYTNRRHL
jgi:hypothetical protein|tara:strand:+ start:739 stop:1143 length:405 start_codon:yes stop_codon:yes gene_type:complete